jgi:uncharacterized protein (TIGR03067 family)
MKLWFLMVLAAGFLLPADGPRADSAPNDKARLQGTWSLVAVEISGQPLAMDKLKDARLVVEGDRYSFKLGDVRLEMSHQTNPGKKPKALDLTVTEGPMKGKTFRAIYELEGDRLKVCRHTEPDKERPTEFASKPGSGIMMVVWKRAQP